MCKEINGNDQIPVISDNKSATLYKWKYSTVLYSISDIFNVIETVEEDSPIYSCVIQVSALKLLIINCQSEMKE